MKLLQGLVLSGLLLNSPIWGKHWHEDDDHWRRHEEHEEHDRDYDRRGRGCYFAPHDVEVISRYYGPRYRSLPPGLERKYYRTGHLPPGWESRMEPLPVVVERELVPVPYGYRRGLLDGFAVVYRPGTGVILDVTAVFGGR